MSEIVQESLNAAAAAADAAELEPAAVQAWPARETIEFKGWLMRFTNGFTHRGNSVATISFNGRDAEEAIDRVEHEYRVRNLAPMFQIASHVVPGDLAERLSSRGYETVTPTVVMATTPARMHDLLPLCTDVRVSCEPSTAFEALVVAGSRSEADGRERMDILSRLSVPHICAVAFAGGHAVACGTATDVAGAIGINLMRTDVAYRRRGYARRVLSAMAQWSSEQGARRVYLGVEKANAPALALYAGAGFRTAYAYRYMRSR